MPDRDPYPVTGVSLPEEGSLEWPARAEYLAWRMAEWAGLPRLGTAMRLGGRDGAAAVSRQSVRFGGDPDQRLEVTVPLSDGATSPADPDLPSVADGSTAVLFVHGGSWRSGAPEDYRFVGNWFARRGLASGVTGYRHVPDNVWPAQRDDVLEAMTVVLESTRARRILLAGHSAGAQLAAAALYDRVARRLAGIGDDAVCGLAAMSGPLDFRVICPTHAECPLLAELMGGDEDWDRADPALLLRPGDGWPVLVMHGARDPLVNVASSVRFSSSAAGAGSPVELVVHPEAGHSTLLWAFLGDPTFEEPLGAFVDAYAGVRTARAAGPSTARPVVSGPSPRPTGKDSA